MKSSTFSYLLCYINVFCAVVFALTHNLPLLLWSFFFAVFNWYLAEWKRGLENEKDNNRESGDSDSSSTSEDDTEDQE